MSAWIKMISDEHASEELSQLLDLSRTPHGTVDNVMRVHSLRPATMHGHVALYRAALHNDANTLAPWIQETIASYVSILNNCPYSLANHWANAKHLINDPAFSARIETALNAHKPEQALEGKVLALVQYAAKLTQAPGEMVERDVQNLRDQGVDDGEILAPFENFSARL